MKRELREYFGGYGTIDNVNMKIDMTTGKSRGFALFFLECCGNHEYSGGGDGCRGYGDGYGSRNDYGDYGGCRGCVAMIMVMVAMIMLWWLWR